MMSWKNLQKPCYFVLAVAAGVLVWWMAASDVAAQSGSRGSRSGSRPPVGGVPRTGNPAPVPQPFEARFWNWLRDVEYRNWAPVPGQGAGHYAGESPHGDFLKMYVNRTVAGNMKDLPHGSILVKENFTQDKVLAAITVMYRSKGYDPDNNDWYYVKYNPQGRVEFKGTAKLAGRVKGCIACHSGAGGKDFVFANDR